jgi:hypothetical protein
MIIGSSGAFDASIPAAECARRLNADRRRGSYVGYANDSGFQFSRYGRTAVRVRGSFSSLATGSRVTYRIEFIPWIIWTLAVALVVEIPMFALFVNRGLLPASVVIWLVVITAIGLPLNLWFSERQARRLRDYVMKVLGAT